MKIQRVAMAMIIVFLTFYLLHLGQTLLLAPSHCRGDCVFNQYSGACDHKPAYKGFSVPKPLADVRRDRNHTLVAFLI